MEQVYQGPEPFVFISYAHKDTNLVLPIIEAFRKRDIRLWYDSGIEAGTEWPDYIAKKLDASQCVLVFVSENAQSSPNCRRELTYAINSRKDILIAYLDECALSPGMQLQLSTLHAIYRTRHADRDSFVNSLCQSKILTPCMDQQGDLGDVAVMLERLIAEAKAGSAQAQYTLGLKYAEGDSVPQDDAEAVSWYSVAAAQKYAPALFRLSKCYYYGKGVPQNFKWMLTLCQEAAEQGYAEAEFALYVYFYKGIGMDPDRKAAQLWCHRAAEHGHSTAQYFLGEYYIDESYSAQDDISKLKYKTTGMQWLMRAAEQGDMYAQYALYSCERDNRDITWCIRAAEQGNREAQKRLGQCYERGIDVAVNHQEAVKWFRCAAEQGDELAQYELSRCYFEGKGVERNLEEAALWLKKALNSGGYAVANWRRELELC